MKRLAWTVGSAFVALGFALSLAACSKPVETVAAPTCDLKAASASAAETALSGCGAQWIDANVRINQLQVIGTHNSYKVAIPENELAIIKGRNPDAGVTLDYSHETLAGQLDKGARQIELDPSDDPEGGLYSTPLMRKLLTEQGVTPADYDLSVMSKPGTKMIHIADIDYRSHCLLFVDCLTQIRTWSDTHAGHTPILIMINPKSSGVSWPGAAKVLPWGKDAFERMEAEIRSVFPAEKMITPDDVRGSHATLREAAVSDGWPLLGKARGRVMFTIDLSPEANAPYAEGHPSLEGRAAFMTTFPDAPEAAYFTMNEPVRDAELIRQRVAQGFLIRTRADADTREARVNDTARREASLASGAQFISTDYQQPDPRFGNDYAVKLPDGAIARCNPVNAPKGCDAKVE